MAGQDRGFGEGVPANPSGFFAQMIGEGTSMRQSLLRYREAGGSIGNERGRRLYEQVRDALVRTPDIMALDPTSLPSATDYATWEMGRGGQYATQVQIQVVDVASGVRYNKQYTHITNQPHTKMEAETEALEIFGDPEVAGDYGEDIQGAVAVRMYQTTPFSP